MVVTAGVGKSLLEIHDSFGIYIPPATGNVTFPNLMKPYRDIQAKSLNLGK